MSCKCYAWLGHFCQEVGKILSMLGVNKVARVHLLPEATMVTTMEVEVEELCTTTVAKIPIIRPVNGFWSKSLVRNIVPVII